MIAPMDDKPGRFYAMTGQMRDATILKLRSRGWTYKRIGAQVGMSESGVKRSIDRINAGGFGEGMSRA